MSDTAGLPAIQLPADPRFREARDRDARDGHLRRAAIAAALLAHVLVIAAVLMNWPALFPAPERPLPAIAVTLVKQPPPAPRPAAATPPPSPPMTHELLSGSDTVTTAPPKAADEGPQAAPPASPPPPLEAPAQTAVAVPKPKPTPDLHSPKPKLATRETAPTRTRGEVDRAPGDSEREGDPYLNHLFAMIEQHRSYPANAVGSLGLRLEGTSVYLIALSGNGALMGVELERSSGAPVLDQTALKMIEAAAPFPPPPNYYPQPVILEVTIHLYPGAG